MVSDARLTRAARAAANVRSDDLPERFVVPNVVDFALKYLKLGSLYPAQGLLLKLMFLQPELLTDDDRDRLDRWMAGFSLPDEIGPRARYKGEYGIAPDILDRIERCRAEGRRWFRENVMVIGRRGGKGYLGAIAFLYVLWHYVALGDPQDHYGIAPSQQLSALVFAGKRDQAQSNQWANIADMIQAAPCFAPFRPSRTGSTLTLYARKQLDSLAYGQHPVPTFSIVAKESTNLAGRGPTSFAHLYDEAAHMINTGTSRDMSEVYAAATPSLSQFGGDAFIYQASSPWTMTGQFFQSYVQALEVNPATGRARHHDMFTAHLPSWAVYEGWEKTR